MEKINFWSHCYLKWNSSYQRWHTWWRWRCQYVDNCNKINTHTHTHTHEIMSLLENVSKTILYSFHFFTAGIKTNVIKNSKVGKCVAKEFSVSFKYINFFSSVSFYVYTNWICQNKFSSVSKMLERIYKYNLSGGKVVQLNYFCR